MKIEDFQLSTLGNERVKIDSWVGIAGIPKAALMEVVASNYYWKTRGTFWEETKEKYFSFVFSQNAQRAV